MLSVSRSSSILLLVALSLYARSTEEPANTSNDLGVLITVATDKAVYKENEPIEIRASVLNGGSRPFYVYPNATFAAYGEGAFWPQLTDASGKEISEPYRVGGHSIAPENADFADYVEQHWILLWPGRFYGVVEKRFRGVRLAPGTYHVRVRYTNSFMPWIFRGWTPDRIDASAKKLKHPAIVGNFESQTAAFRVVR